MQASLPCPQDNMGRSYVHMRLRELMFVSRRAAIGVFVFCLLLQQSSVGASELAAKASKSACSITALERSSRSVRIILDDLAATYTEVGGGGISEIRQIATDVFRVSLLQEERTDILTYHFKVDNKCDIAILTKEASAFSP